jgi:hypothetical protein
MQDANIVIMKVILLHLISVLMIMGAAIAIVPNALDKPMLTQNDKLQILNWLSGYFDRYRKRFKLLRSIAIRSKELFEGRKYKHLLYKYLKALAVARAFVNAKYIERNSIRRQ